MDWASQQRVTPCVTSCVPRHCFTNSTALQYRGNGTGIFNTELTIDRTQNPGKRTYAANTYYRGDKPNLIVFLATQVGHLFYYAQRSH